MRRKSRLFLLLILLLFLLLFLIMIGILLVQRARYGRDRIEIPGPSGGMSGGVDLVLDPDAEEDPRHENNDNAERGVVIAGRESVTVSADKREAAVDFFNPDENAQLYYLTFELRLYGGDGQGYEVLYTSGLVEPGKHIRRITLSRSLEKGVYEAVIHVQPYRMNEEKTPTNNADMRIRLIVD